MMRQKPGDAAREARKTARLVGEHKPTGRAAQHGRVGTCGPAHAHAHAVHPAHRIRCGPWWTMWDFAVHASVMDRCGPRNKNNGAQLFHYKKIDY